MHEKRCSKCNETRPIEEFAKRLKAKDGHQAWCRMCQREVDLLRWANRSEDHARKKTDRVERTKKFVKDYLREHPCVDCGEDDIVVLDFDHVRGAKRNSISLMYGHSVRTIQEEIDKCEVRCANCHRRATAKRREYHHSEMAKLVDAPDC